MQERLQSIDFVESTVSECDIVPRLTLVKEKKAANACNTVICGLSDPC